MNIFIASVVVPINVSQSYSYICDGNLPVGSVVEVSFGNQTYYGLVLSVASASEVSLSFPLDKLKPIKKILPICLSANFVAFINFFANYTLTPLGLVATLLLRNFSPEPMPYHREYIIKAHPLPSGIKITPQRQKVLDCFAYQPYWQQKRLALEAEVSDSIVSAMLSKGLLNKQILNEAIAIENKNDNLSQEQQVAANKLCKALDNDSYKAFLLSGVTGCGKTEVYFKAIERALQKGGQVLILVPEIALTQQLITRFENRLGFKPDSWHSSKSKNNKQALWWAVINGNAKVVIGARSALFLPFSKLRLIIVDEEHDNSYKQDENIYYNARDMAVARASFEKAIVILSSATPSLETVVNANRGKYEHINLSQRYNNIKLPKLSLVDMNLSGLDKGSFISPELLETLKENLAKHQQSILFIGRRGYAPLTICNRCGHRVTCPNCSVYMVEHHHSASMQCHYCGYTEKLPPSCSECGADPANWISIGCGVERIAKEVSLSIPEARICVLSTDIIGNIKALREQFALIEQGEVDIIIGTQIISKGHNFGKVSLVGVIDADLSLHNPDLRAAERTYQTIMQVTGRAGRTGLDSIGIIQTYNPNHPVLQAILSNLPERFYEQEIKLREQSNMPPFTRLAAIIISGPDNKTTEDYAKLLRRTMVKAEGVEIFGPSPAPIAMLRNQYRYRILIKSTLEIKIQSYINNLLKHVAKPLSGINLQIDLDPQSFF